MQRRTFLKTATLSAVATQLPNSSALAAPTADTSKPRPNVIIIMADDVGYSDLGCYGSEINTPTLDGLAKNGLRYTQFYNAGRCCPTRASLLTGLYPHQAGVGHMMNDRKLPGYRGNLGRDCVTIPEALTPAGYRAYMAGKWHVTPFRYPENPKDNPKDKSNWPTARGFDRFYGTIAGGGDFYNPAGLARDTDYISPYADPEYKPKTFYYTDAISHHATKFVREHAKDHADKPFFLYVAYTAAHWPMHALPEDIAKYKGKYDNGYTPIRKARFERMKKLGVIEDHVKLSPQAGDWKSVKNKKWESACMEVYAAMLDRMDQGIGQIVAELKKTGQLDNTLILFLQDNGGCAETMGRRGVGKPRPPKPTLPAIPPEQWPSRLVPRQTRDGYPVRQGVGAMPGPKDTYIGYGQGWANVSDTPFRMYKHYVHEGGISTPLIAHWPKGIKRTNELDATPGHLIDLMATCVDLSGASYPTKFAGKAIQPLEGQSLAPSFAGKETPTRPLFFEHEGNRALRIGQWKLVAKGARGKWELYVMTKDRSELNNLAAKMPKKLAAMAKQWTTTAKRVRALPAPWSKSKTKKSKQNKKK